MKLLSKLSADDTLNFPPEEVKHVVYAFTDVDCGYCRVLHENIEGYKAAGIEIRYLAYPRAGIDSKTYKKMVSAWCSDDPNEAIGLLKRGKSIKQASCENPVEDQFELGKKMRISGTPALILEDGQVIPGFVPPARLKAALTPESTS